MFDEQSCEALNGAGFPCMMRPLTGERWCWSHSPDKRAAANDARRKGGSHSRGADTSPVPADLDASTAPGRMELVGLAIRDTWQQANCPARSRALAGLLRLAHDLDSEAEAIEIREELQALTLLVDQAEKERHGY
jgi:hypothetical protein